MARTAHPSRLDAFTGLPVDVDDESAHRWAAGLFKAVLAILVAGILLSAILWAIAKPDVGALALSAVFAACAGLMVIRQAILAERG